MQVREPTGQARAIIVKQLLVYKTDKNYDLLPRACSRWKGILLCSGIQSRDYIVPIGPSGANRGLWRHASSPRYEPIIRITSTAVSSIYQFPLVRVASPLSLDTSSSCQYVILTH
jgi:hypothetical protein